MGKENIPLLKLDRYVERLYDQEIESWPDEPLSESEKAYLFENYLEYFQASYCRGHIKSCLIDEIEKHDSFADLKSEANIKFFRCLKVFDKKGLNITSRNIEGPKNGKTLDFFFVNFLNQSVNWATLSVVDKSIKKSFGLEFFYEDAPDERIYDLVDENTVFSEYNFETLEADAFFRDLKTCNPTFQRFFIFKYIYQLSIEELQKEFGGSSFFKLCLECSEFLKEFRDRMGLPEPEIESKVKPNK